MTSQISNVRTKQFCYRLMALTAFMFVFLCGHAQQGQPSMAQQLAALQRLEAMQPDSIGPKYQQAVLLLGYVCTHPQDGKAQQYLEEAQRMQQQAYAEQQKKNRR